MGASRRILTFLIIAAVSASIGCGVSQNTSKTTPTISIALDPAPSATSISVGNTTGVQFTPVVSNDASHSGVDWAVTCPVSSCGTLSIFPALHSASGAAVTYLPPASLPTASLVVNITVFATADHAQNVTTPVTVSSYASVLSGNYVLQVVGSDGSANAYQATGVFAFDGNGNITSGQETINSSFSGFSSSAYTVQGASGTASTYFIGADGRGTITLNLQQINNGPRTSVSQTFTLEVLSTSKALVLEADASSSTAIASAQNSASGTLELQDSTAAAATPTGAYAFVTNGTDSNSPTGPLGGSAPAPTAIGGVINIDNNPSPGSISGNGSLADQDYYNSSGTRMLESCAAPTGVKGSVSSPPSSLGVVTITLTGATCFAIAPPGTIQLTGYIVDATHIRLIESDDVNGTSGFLTAGIAVSQGSAAGTFTNASLSGPYVYGVLGFDIFTDTVSSFTSAGVIKADGNGHLAGISDTAFPGASEVFTASAISGGYSVDSTRIGRAQLAPAFGGGISPAPLPTVLFYLTGIGAPPLVLWSEGADPSFPAVGAGIAYPQAANAAAFSFGNPETYGVSFTQNASGGEIDGSGEMSSSVNGVTGTLSGAVDDTNSVITSTPLPPLLDTFTLPADGFGRIAGTFLSNPGLGPGPFVEYYLASDNQGFFVEIDFLTSSSVALGYFAQACEVTSATSCQMAAAAASPKRALAPRVRIKH